MNLKETSELPQSVSLTKLVIDTAFRPDLAIPNNIQSIVIDGELEGLRNGLVERTKVDIGIQPLDVPERGRGVYVLPSRKLLFDSDDSLSKRHKNDVVGINYSPKTPRRLISNPQNNHKYSSLKYFYGGFVHTHGGIPLPLSGMDLLPLLLRPSRKEAAAFMGLVDQTQNVFAFRTEGTPTFSHMEALSLLTEYDLKYINAINIHHYIEPNMTYEENIAMHREVASNILREYGQIFDLKIFHSNGENVLTLDYYKATEDPFDGIYL